MWLGGKGDLLGIMQEIDMWTNYQIAYTRTKTRCINSFEIQTEHRIPARRSDH